jgi:cholesterol transport system auxiliary component
MTPHPILRSLLPLFALAPLAACASLLAGGKPDSLYRFGISARDMTIHSTDTTAQQHAIRLARFRFAPEIEGDRILTASGDGVLYLKNARWVSPAPDLMMQAIVHRFDERAPTIRLTPAMARSSDSMQLRLAFDRFEARYDAGSLPDTPPTILVSGTAELSETAGLQPRGQRSFWVEETATANTRAAIVSAFDRAVKRYTVELVDWTVQTDMARGPAPAK